MMDKFQVEANLCKGGVDCDPQHLTGTWSTIYDQAYQIQLENGLRFLANFRYSLKDYTPATTTPAAFAQMSSLKTGDYAKFNSECDKSMVGFVQTVPSLSDEVYSLTKHRVQCFYGVQETHYDMEKTVSVKTDSDAVKVAVITQQNKIEAASKPEKAATAPADAKKAPVKEEHKKTEKKESKVDEPKKDEKQATGNRSAKTRFNAHIEHAANDETDAAISFINKADLGWKADVCKLQKHHADYGSHCDAADAKSIPESTLAQVESEQLEGASRKGKAFGPESGEPFDAAVAKAQAWYTKYASADEIMDSEIPETYDLRDIDGFDFTNPLRDQGACGSCYTVSFT